MMFDSQLRKCSGSMWGDILRPRKLKEKIEKTDFQKQASKLLEDGTDLQSKSSSHFAGRHVSTAWLKDVSFSKTLAT